MSKTSPALKKIQMVDLVGQHQHYHQELNKAIDNVLNHGAFINGPEVKVFAQQMADFLQVKQVVPCANGTDAIQIALMALGLEKGDEVITTSFNYVAAAEACSLLGLTPVFTEVENDTYNLDVAKLEAKITPKTKAIIAVHLFGQACDMEKVMAIASQRGIKVIEDNAQSLGTEIIFKGQNKMAGTIGHIGTTSFFPTKNLGCLGDGGALFSNDQMLAERCKSISAHGQGQRYEFKQTGVNSRLDTLQAAVLSVKIQYLKEALAKRAQAANLYNNLLQMLPGLELPKTANHTTHTYNQYTVLVKNSQRDNLKHYLSESGIPTMVYYPKPLHLQPAFAYLGIKNDLQISESLCQEVLSLPIHPELEEEQVRFIAEAIEQFFGK